MGGSFVAASSARSFFSFWESACSLFCLLISDPLTSADRESPLLRLLLSFSCLRLGDPDLFVVSFSSSLLLGNGFRSSVVLGDPSTPVVLLSGSSLVCK